MSSRAEPQASVMDLLIASTIRTALHHERNRLSFKQGSPKNEGIVRGEKEKEGVPFMFDFEKTYKELVEAEGGSPELKPILRELYDSLVTRPADPMRMKATLCRTLEFLTSPGGRTDENCKAVDLFICYDVEWEADPVDLPEDYKKVVFDMGCELHDTFQAPAVALYFEATPEQLLARVKQLRAA
jgi:hypothetical protein